MKNLFVFVISLFLGTAIYSQTTITRIATDDVWIKNGDPAFNQSQPQLLNVKGNNEELTYLKFDISGLSGTLQSAKLRFSRHTNSTDLNIEVHEALTNLNWAESTTNIPAFSWSNRPGAGTNGLEMLASAANGLNSGEMDWTLDETKIDFNDGELTLVLRRTVNVARTKFKARNATTTNTNDDPILELTFAGNCSDGIKNGDEEGVDCGGSCPNACSGGGNSAPSVSFTAPMNNETFTETEAQNGITVTASASDVDGNLTNVDLKVDGVSQGVLTAAPYEWTLQNLGVDSYDLELTATDSDGATDVEMISISVVADNNNGGGGTGTGTGVWSQVANSNNIYYDTGNVGIGTASPSELLHVAGEIYAVRVRVNTAAGADFVFEDGYQLMTLEEVEAYVKQNKHLPEIPSEQEMIDNDLQLGEFSIKLLQKVEELTLYMIEQEKQIKALQAKNSLLEQRLIKMEEKD